jgi:hypothetical protein
VAKPDHKRNEELRRRVLEILAERPSVALTASALTAYLRDLGIRADEEEAATAAQFLAGLTTPWVLRLLPPLGSTPSWQITATGQLQWERGDY